MLWTRAEFYELCVESLSPAKFKRLFGVAPMNIYSVGYSFNKVHWNMNFEFAYNEYIAGEEG